MGECFAGVVVLNFDGPLNDYRAVIQLLVDEVNRGSADLDAVLGRLPLGFQPWERR